MTTAQAEYQARQARIQTLVQELQSKLASHSAKATSQPLSWGFTGDLGHIEERLQELVGFLGD